MLPILMVRLAALALLSVPADTTPARPDSVARRDSAAKPAPVEPAKVVTLPRIRLRGFAAVSMVAQDHAFGFGNGANAEWVQAPATHGTIFSGDVRSTRLGMTIGGDEIAKGVRASATIEGDFFGSFNGATAFSVAQPQPRLRTAYVDVTRGGTTLRIGQAALPLCGLIPASATHLAFPLGFGSGGFLGWREPGISVFQVLTAPAARTRVQVHLAAARTSWSGAASVVEPRTAGETFGTPQLEARLDVSHQKTWSAYAVVHYDEKELTPAGDSARRPIVGRALELGGRVERGRLTLQGNAWRGRAMAQQFGMLAQFGDIAGWGGWGQAGLRLTPTLSLWTFQGIDDPNDADVVREVSGASRLRNRLGASMLRYQAGDYTLGLEWMRAATAWRLDGGAHAMRRGNQLALSAIYAF